MTNIRLVYNPFTKEAEVYCENKKISAEENKIYMFLKTNGFYECLLPFNKRYVIWQGLLPELMIEVNDDELHILFEGTKEDFQTLENSFTQSEIYVNNLGYENNWVVSYLPNFTVENLVQTLCDTAENMKDICESRAELHEIDNYLSDAHEIEAMEAYQKLKRMIAGHLKKWENSNNKYKDEKKNFIEHIIMSNLRELEIQYGLITHEEGVIL